MYDGAEYKLYICILVEQTIRNKTTEDTESTENMELNEISEKIIGAAMQVHSTLGLGLLESAYEACLKYEHRKKQICRNSMLFCNYVAFGSNMSFEKHEMKQRVALTGLI